jgi:diguanylate cyclase (GGDEF)-like protein/PAS domain S-box-containing protein
MKSPQGFSLPDRQLHPRGLNTTMDMIAPQKVSRPKKRKPGGKAARLPYWDTDWGAKAYANALDELVSMSVTDLKGRIIYANENFLKATQYSREEIVGQDHSILNSGHHLPEFFASMYRSLRAGKPWRAPIKNRAKDGTYYWVDALIAPLKNGEGRKIGYVSVRFDITSAVNLHVELGHRTQLLQSVLANFPGGISVYDSGERMILCNERQKAMLDLPAELFAKGPPTLEQILRSNAERGEYGDGDVADLVASKLNEARPAVARVYERHRPNGTCLEVRTAPMSGGGFIATYLDITERKRDQAIIAKLAHHDALTGLPNRLLFQDRIEVGLGRVERGETMALLYLDLDRFKSVNDTLGHPVGDALLKAVAGRLKAATRTMDTVARLGGDEFAILLMGTKSLDDVASIARRIIATVSQPYEIGKHAITIGTSIGIAMAPNDGRDPDKLLKNADLALYRSKSEGRGSYSFFEQKMHDSRCASSRRDCATPSKTTAFSCTISRSSILRTGASCHARR